MHGVASALGGIFVGLLVSIAWFGFGDVLVRLLPTPRAGSSALALTTRIALGVGATSLVLFALGVVGFYRSWAAWALILGGVALSFLAWRRPTSRESPAASRQVSKLWQLSLCIILSIVCISALLAACAPPTARDALLYHLSVPKAFVRAGALVELPQNLMSYTPQGVELHFLWAMLAGSASLGERAAPVVGLCFAVAACLAVWEWARCLGTSRFWSLAAACGIASIPTAWAVATSAYADLAAALFVALTAHALGRWYESLERAWLLRFALFFGFALSFKMTVAFLGLPILLVMLWRARSVEQQASAAGALGLGVCALLLAAVIGSPWYLRNWALSGSPVFPMFLGLWPADVPAWDAERSALHNRWLLSYGQEPKTILSYVTAPIRVSLSGRMDSPTHYDGVLGLFFLAGAPLVLLARRQLPGSLRVALAPSFVLLLLWLTSSQQLRYLLPALPTAAVAVAFAAHSLASRADRTATLSPLLALAFIAIFGSNLLVILRLYSTVSPTAVALGGESREAYLERQLAYYPFYKTANQMLPGQSRVWLIDMRNDTYYLERPALSDYFFEDWTLARLVRESPSVEALADGARRLGVTHVMMRYPLLFDEAHSPLVDPTKPEESQRRLSLLRDFLFNYSRILQRDNNYIFVEIPPRAG